MRTRSFKKESVNIVTLGCSKNLVDSEDLLTQLKGNNILVEHESIQNNFDTVIINTCGFIDQAKQESIDTILRYTQAKNEGLIKKVFVTGCLSQRYREELRHEIPEVDAWYGTFEMPLLLNRFKANYKKELIGDRLITTSQHYAYLKIAEGCDRPCSFCSIPAMRGKHRSKKIEDILTEAHNLVKKGVKEILIIAQDSTYYGWDIYKKRMLGELLKNLAKIDGLEWIRIHYAFPMGFPEDVMEVMATHENICNYIDIPLQHASTKMLKIMRRGTTHERTQKLIDSLRAQVPNIAIRTTFLIGHPGEDESDFEALEAFVSHNKFERVGVFTYSHEENTHSFTMENNVAEATKEKRAASLMNLQERISEEWNESLIGKELKVLIDRKENGYCVGRTEYDSPEVDNEVWIYDEKKDLKIGQFVKVKITQSSAFDLYGNPSQYE